MNEFLVLRHGQSLGDIENRHEGRADLPLTDLGRQQARLASEWIASRYPLDLLVSSPLKRAAETAEIVAQQLGIIVEYSDYLKEHDNGVLAGMLISEAEELYPSPPGGYKPHESVPDGESFIAFRTRAEIMWSHLMSKVISNQRVGIIAHGGIITMLFRSFINLPMQTDVRIVTGDTGIHLWRVEDSVRRIVFMNSISHLQNE